MPENRLRGGILGFELSDPRFLAETPLQLLRRCCFEEKTHCFLQVRECLSGCCALTGNIQLWRQCHHHVLFKSKDCCELCFHRLTLLRFPCRRKSAFSETGSRFGLLHESLRFPQNPKSKIQNPKLPPAMPVSATQDFSKLANARPPEAVILNFRF